MPLPSMLDSQQLFHSGGYLRLLLSMEVFACYFGGDDAAIIVDIDEPGLTHHCCETWGWSGTWFSKICIQFWNVCSANTVDDDIGYIQLRCISKLLAGFFVIKSHYFIKDFSWLLTFRHLLWPYASVFWFMSPSSWFHILFEYHQFWAALRYNSFDFWCCISS